MGKMFCPRCKSFDVAKELTTSMIWGSPQKWKCNNCGYENYLFPEMEEIKNKSKVK